MNENKSGNENAASGDPHSDNYQTTHPHYNLKYLLLDRKTDVVAFTALLLTFINLSAGAYYFYFNADIVHEHPNTVLIWAYGNQNDKRYLSVSADLAYINSSNKTQNAVLKEENVTIESIRCPSDNTLITINKELRAGYYEQMVIGGKKVSRVNTRAALPKQIPGLSVASHGSSFFPHERDCRNKQSCETFGNYLKMKDFIEILKQCPSIPEGKVELQLSFTAEYYGASPTKIQCDLLIHQAEIKNLDDEMRTLKSTNDIVNSYGWVNRTCFPVKNKS